MFSFSITDGRKTAVTTVLVFLIFIVGYKFYHSSPTPDTTKSVPAQIYPDQQNYWKFYEQRDVFPISIISDMDKASKVAEGMWSSHFLNGVLRRQPNGMFSITWDPEPEMLYGRMNEGGRGMELSELSNFNHRLYSGDDRTGIVYELIPAAAPETATKAVPRYILMDGNGDTTKGFKVEWSTVKDGKLFVGSIGKEWVDNGVIKTKDPMWVKTISKLGVVEHHNWEDIYNKLRVISGTTPPGYLLHEAVGWNPVNRRWYFFPRRVSFLPYDEELDEERCGNIGLWTDEEFKHVELIKDVGLFDKMHGFSTFKFLPFSTEEIVVLKSQEKPQLTTYIMVVNIKTKQILLEETKIANLKYEGIEFM